jgi:flagellin-like protein
MQLQALLTEDRAVSPVIGVILMVAITVILAAVIGTFVLGLGQNVQSTPQASFSFDFTASNTTVDITHTGGDTLEKDENANTVEIISTAGGASRVSWLAGNSTIGAGDTYVGYDYAQNGSTVRVVWTSVNNESSSALGSQQAPA